jgi:SAM-dependent methyltransferase
MDPSEVALRDTHDFVRCNLQPHSTILEVGCGNGALAASLQQDGHQLLAVDLSEDAVRQTRDRGVAAQCCDFVDFPRSGTFDALVFARSLHHIHPLDTAINHAFEHLRPGGVLLVDDFDHEAMDRDTARWLYSVSEMLWLAGITTRSEFPGLSEREPLEHWLDEHSEQPPLHSGPRMAAAAAARFPDLRQASCCYLFRYFCRDLRDGTNGDRIASNIQRLEASLIERGRIKAIGLRLVAPRSRTARGGRAY